MLDLDLLVADRPYISGSKLYDNSVTKKFTPTYVAYTPHANIVPESGSLAVFFAGLSLLTLKRRVKRCI